MDWFLYNNGLRHERVKIIQDSSNKKNSALDENIRPIFKLQTYCQPTSWKLLNYSTCAICFLIYYESICQQQTEMFTRVAFSVLYMVGLKTLKKNNTEDI